MLSMAKHINFMYKRKSFYENSTTCFSIEIASISLKNEKGPQTEIHATCTTPRLKSVKAVTTTDFGATFHAIIFFVMSTLLH